VGGINSGCWSSQSNEDGETHPYQHYHSAPKGWGIPFPDPSESGKRASVEVGEPHWETEGQATDEKLQENEQRSVAPSLGSEEHG